MKASELVEMLLHQVEHYGDREVVFAEYALYDSSNLIESAFQIEDVTHEESAGKPVIVVWDR